MTAPERQCRIVLWVDADTCDVEVQLCLTVDLKDLGIPRPFNVAVALPKRLRVYGIDTPEKRSRNLAERDAALAAVNHARLLAPEGTVVTARAAGDEKFGRYLASVRLPDGKDFAEEMVKAGHAKQYFGEAKEEFHEPLPMPVSQETE